MKKTKINTNFDTKKITGWIKVEVLEEAIKNNLSAELHAFSCLKIAFNHTPGWFKLNTINLFMIHRLIGYTELRTTRKYLTRLNELGWISISAKSDRIYIRGWKFVTDFFSVETYSMVKYDIRVIRTKLDFKAFAVFAVMDHLNIWKKRKVWERAKKNWGCRISRYRLPIQCPTPYLPTSLSYMVKRLGLCKGEISRLKTHAKNLGMIRVKKHFHFILDYDQFLEVCDQKNLDLIQRVKRINNQYAIPAPDEITTSFYYRS
jgi:hypothetical protein